MAWSNFTDADFASGKPFTQSKAQGINNNFAAMAAGDAGAPKTVYAAMSFSNDIAQGDLAANCVGQSELKDTSGDVSTSSASTLTLPGGNYGFFPSIRNSIGGSESTELFAASATNNTTSFATRLHLTETGAAAGVAYARQYYFTASPPYNLGDGDIPLFMFVVVVNSTNEVESMYSAAEAPWHYNGPTQIKAKYIRADGMPCRMVSRAIFEQCVHNVDIKSALQDPTTRDQALDFLRDKTPVEMEIRQEIKNRDMALIPHPFDDPGPDKTIVLIDPVSTLAEEMRELQHSGEMINDLFHEGYLKVDNTPLSRAAPNGVPVHGCKWK